MSATQAVYWGEWLASDRSEARFRTYSLSLVKEMQRAAQAWDLELAAALLQTYTYVERHITEEPLLSTYEKGLMYMTLVLADCLIIKGDLDAAEHNDFEVLDTLERGDARRQRLGEPPRPSSEIRFTALGQIAACQVERILAGEPVNAEAASGLIETFWQVAERVEAFFEQPDNQDSERQALVFHALARWELEIAKLALCCVPEMLPEAVSEFNRRHGDHLRADPQSLTAGDPPASAWYWDFELTRGLLGDQPSLNQIEDMSRKRQELARLTFGSAPLGILLRLWQHQMQEIRSEAAASSKSRASSQGLR